MPAASVAGMLHKRGYLALRNRSNYFYLMATEHPANSRPPHKAARSPGLCGTGTKASIAPVATGYSATLDRMVDKQRETDHREFCMKSIGRSLYLAVVVGFLLSRNGAVAQHNGKPVVAAAKDDLRLGFENPPREAQLRCYWWWMNGYTTACLLYTSD